MGNDLTKLHRALERHAGRGTGFYSLALHHPALGWMGDSPASRLRTARRLADRDPSVNLFRYGDVWYVGTEERRADYQRDRDNGCNLVEDMIAAGAYE